jgi:large subunit ribosomal protein L25
VRGVLRKDMMEEIVVEANRRKIVGKRVKALRREGRLPAIMYGKHVDTIPVVLDLRDATKTLGGLSPSALIQIHLDGEEYFALVREKQRDVLRGTLTHVDFQAVSLTETVRAEVAIDLVGESPAVKDMGGILVTNVEQLDVEALPRDLPERIEVDVSHLEDIGDAIYVRDLSLPESVTVFAEPDDVIVVVTLPAEEIEEEEEEVEVVEELLEGAEPEVIERRREEEEEEEEE